MTSSWKPSSTVKPGQNLPLLSGVPAGWTCDVAETPVSGQLFDDSYRWSDPVIRIDGTEGTRAQIVAGETTLVDVENPIERVLGGVEILKVLDANIPPGVVVDPSFQGAYTCVYQAGTAREETFGGTCGSRRAVRGIGVGQPHRRHGVPRRDIVLGDRGSASGGSRRSVLGMGCPDDLRIPSPSPRRRPPSSR